MTPKRKCCGFIDLKTGVIIITIFSLLNKLSGFFGLISLPLTDPFAILTNAYTIIAFFLIAYGLRGILTDTPSPVHIYSHFYVIDLFLNAILTIFFSVVWFSYTEHITGPLMPEEDMPIQPPLEPMEDAERLWIIEGWVSVTALIIIWIVHIYFAFVVRAYSNLLRQRNASPGLYTSLPVAKPRERDIEAGYGQKEEEGLLAKDG